MPCHSRSSIVTCSSCQFDLLASRIGVPLLLCVSSRLLLLWTGGSYAISVYEIIDPTPSPTPTPVKPTPSPVKPTPTSVKPTPAPVDNSEPGDDHVSLGCYADAVSARIMGAIALVSSTMTTEASYS